MNTLENPLLPLRGFIGETQSACLLELIEGEEGDWFRERLFALTAILREMPSTYGTDGQGENAIAYLHYFTPGCDWWLVEKDKGAPDDEPEQFQSQAFGLVDLGYGPELGYINLPEALAAGAELDLHWKPIAIKQIKEGRES